MTYAQNNRKRHLEIKNGMTFDYTIRKLVPCQESPRKTFFDSSADEH